MYYLAKLAEASGLTVIVIGFIKSYPGLLNPKVFMAGIVLFGFGWIVEFFLLRKR